MTIDITEKERTLILCALWTMNHLDNESMINHPKQAGIFEKDIKARDAIVNRLTNIQ